MASPKPRTPSSFKPFSPSPIRPDLDLKRKQSEIRTFKRRPKFEISTAATRVNLMSNYIEKTLEGEPKKDVEVDKWQDPALIAAEWKTVSKGLNNYFQSVDDVSLEVDDQIEPSPVKAKPGKKATRARKVRKTAA
eukprot:TRINITY_DN28072_c0_g1_i1.p1 TRINITY_DN28072_c0_g1~~TRINITY_DN28072_c0_g1_i1.p1  ORF type:complete len:143 (-),score=11.40 TRINITY_DN28072_c0_g1_i1:295-699(-)